jgi:hypothetical protein
MAMQTANQARRVIAYDSATDGKVFNLDKPAADNAAMCDYWDQTDAIIAGVKGLMAKPTVFLPKFPNESKKDWEFRQSLSKLTNVFRDIVEDLASRPFEAPVTIKSGTLPADFDDLLNNIDGSGNNITAFSADTFFNGITSAIDWIFIDYPNVASNGKVRSVADEKAAGIRPYWTHVRGRNMLEIKSAIGANGIERLEYARILEPVGDEIYVRIIKLDPANVVTWELWKALPLQGSGRNIQREFILDSAGIMGIDVIPLVPFMTGRRKGRSWVFDPALRDASDLQLNVFRNETNLEYAKVMTAYPMLSGNGVKPAMAADGKTVLPVPVGPGAALYAPPDGAGHAGSWSFIEIAATSLEFLRKDIGETITQLRELGRQPLTSQSGNLTVITTAVAAKKGNSAVQAWAGSLAMAIAAALVITGKWKNVEVKPEVQVFTDFDVDGSGGDELTSLRESRKMGDLSQETLWNEYQRRNVLSAEFDPDKERERLLAETPVDPGDGENEEPDGGGDPDATKTGEKPPIPVKQAA